MDEDKLSYLKRFGFLPASESQKQKLGKRIGRQKSERYYVRDDQGIYLTTRETEASYLMARGCTVRETADELGLSPRTIEFYLSNIRRKLGVRNKNELLRVLHDNDFFRQLK